MSTSHDALVESDLGRVLDVPADWLLGGWQ
jgi:hypothetical protein